MVVLTHAHPRSTRAPAAAVRLTAPWMALPAALLLSAAAAFKSPAAAATCVRCQVRLMCTSSQCQQAYCFRCCCADGMHSSVMSGADLCRKVGSLLLHSSRATGCSVHAAGKCPCLLLVCCCQLRAGCLACELEPPGLPRSHCVSNAMYGSCSSAVAHAAAPDPCGGSRGRQCFARDRASGTC